MLRAFSLRAVSFAAVAALLLTWSAVRAQGTVPLDFECPPGSPRYDSLGIDCTFASDDWLMCVFDTIDLTWRMACLNEATFSPALPVVDKEVLYACDDPLFNKTAPPYYDIDCIHGGKRNCYYNPATFEYVVNCTCDAGWVGLRCERCVSDDVCVTIGQDLSTTSLPCDVGPTPVATKYFECNATDALIRDTLGGGRISVEVSPGNGTGSVVVYTRETGPPALFKCNVTGCVFDVVEESAGLTYTYSCAFTSCQCPFIPGTNHCIDQPTEDTVAIIKTKANVRCKGLNSADKLSCVFDQAELGVLINVDCFAGECAAPPSYESQMGVVIGQIAGVFLALLALMGLPVLLWLIYSSLKSGSRSLHPRRGASVEFASVRYEIELSGGAWLPSFIRGGCCGSKTLRVLDDVYGAVYPGELCCILGESGSGKTSLLDILAGMDKSGHVKGSILIDGRARPRDFKVHAGYVQQHDAMLGTLTVEEQLTYSAQLRLPADVKRSDKLALVQQTMKELGLLHRKDTLIGSSEKRGVSGGEKRRASIATELVSQPRVLFLDEPTSGLDSSRALSVMTLLKTLVQQHAQTILCSIHQPRSNIFQLFDRVILLAKGKVIYSGPRSHIIKFFKRNGYVCPKGFNHADFLIDTVTTESDDKLLVLATKAREYYASLKPPTSQQDNEVQEVMSLGRNARPGWLVQVALLTQRAFVNLWRNPVLLKTHGIATILIAIFLGLAYMNLANNVSGFQNRVGSLFFVITLLSFSCLSALDLFISERPIFIRERANGCYETGPYFVAKIFTDLLPLRVVLPTLFATIVFWMAAYSSNVAHFVRYLIVIVLVNFTCASLLFVISALARSLAAATFLSSILILVQLLFSGLLLNFDSIPVYIRWIRYLSFLGYAYEAAVVNELAGLAIDVDISAAEARGGLTLSGSIFLEAFAFKIDNFWADVGILASYGGLYLLIAYVCLRIFVKYKS